MTSEEFRKASRKKPKYGNRKVEIDGIKFDSVLEARYYQTLILKKKAGLIDRFDRQVRYDIIVNGEKICTYRADFVVHMEDGKSEVVDCKGFKTKEYILKKKLIKAVFGIVIKEVVA